MQQPTQAQQEKNADVSAPSPLRRRLRFSPRLLLTITLVVLGAIGFGACEIVPLNS